MAVEVNRRIIPQSISLLLRRMIIAASFSIVIIMVGGGYGIYRIYSNHILHDAEEDAVHLTEVLIQGQHDLLFARGENGRPRLFIDPANRTLLEQDLRQFLHPFRIAKVKIYDVSGRILFSTEPNLTGEVDHDNFRLQRALRGQIDSHLEKKDALRDLADERKLDVDVVECYVPIHFENAVVGSFEVYADVTRYRHEIVTTVADSVLILGSILLTVFGIFFFFVKAAAQRVTDAQQQLHTLATTDALTGAFNRGTILAHAREEISRIERRRLLKNDYTLSFILLDIDHFKQINDTYGHLVGDKVLEEMIQRVREAARDYDLIGRFGGEEFLLILPDSGFEGAVAAAERVCQAVGSCPFAINAGDIQVTVSLGVATSRPGEQNLDEVLQRADAGLYRAKAEGRNRVAWIEPRPVI